jgi:Holliday junction DNA helicase RuvA
MFAYIKGLLIQSTASYATVDAAGVGYKLFVPANLFARLPPLGSEVLLHTSFVVRELSQTLYGFMTTQERDLFETLMGVTGVGPKLSLSLVGHLSLQDLQNALLQGNIYALSKVPGVGKKIAERLTLELRDKVTHIFATDPSTFAISLPIDPHMQKINDAMSALIHLGYHQNVAQKAIKKALNESSEEVELARLITDALKYT